MTPLTARAMNEREVLESKHDIVGLYDSAKPLRFKISSCIAHSRGKMAVNETRAAGSIFGF